SPVQPVSTPPVSAGYVERPATAENSRATGGSVQHVTVNAIHPLPGQPRRKFDETAISELAESIKLRGVLQPIIVRRSPDGDGYQLVAGERRWRASQSAGLDHVPALVRDLDDA